MSAGTAVFLAHGSARDWARRRSPGDTVAWRADVVVVPPEWSSAAPGEGRGAQTAAMAAPVREAVGGFPELLRDGRPVLDQQRVVPAFGVNRHPRTAIGWSGADRLFLVVVDGRQPDASVGMSLDELTWVFQRLGATHAVNLDGGGSSAMVVQGRVVNSPSDREGERAVGNALVLAGCGAVGSRQ
jgi:exopolysaccharide biosynthesis protein